MASSVVAAAPPPPPPNMVMEDSSFDHYDLDKQLMITNNVIFSILESKFLHGSCTPPPPPPVANINPLLAKFVQEYLKSTNDVVQADTIGKVRILSIDALGSTDGLLAATSLSHLEASLRHKSSSPNATIADFFDVAAGSGVGGILVALLFTKGKDGRPIFTANQALQFLLHNHTRLANSSSSTGIFRRMFRRSSKSGKLLRRIFGDSTLKDTLKPVLIPCYDLSTGAPFVFSRADALETDSYDFKMSEVCVATSAAVPTTAVELRSIDKRTKIQPVGGGLAMNNPTAAAITHVLNNKQEFPFCDGVEDLLVVSLGNGESVPAATGRNLTVPSTGYGFLRIAGEGASDTVDQAVSMAFGEFRSGNYVRIQGITNNNNGFKSSSSTSEGEKLLGAAEVMLRQKNVESVMFCGKKLDQKSNIEKLEQFSAELIKEQERRIKSTTTMLFPTVMFKQPTSPTTRTTTVSTMSSPSPSSSPSSC